MKLIDSFENRTAVHYENRLINNFFITIFAESLKNLLRVGESYELQGWRRKPHSSNKLS